jgi:hypothetical protein
LRRRVPVLIALRLALLLLPLLVLLLLLLLARVAAWDTPVCAPCLRAWWYYRSGGREAA